MRLVLLALILVVAPGCDVDGCETFVYDGPALTVFVRNAETGELLSDGVSVVAERDGVSEQLTLVDSPTPLFEGLSLARDSPPIAPGAYAVTVSAEGYEQARGSAEVVADDFCYSVPRPSGPAQLDFDLTPYEP